MKHNKNHPTIGMGVMLVLTALCSSAAWAQPMPGEFRMRRPVPTLTVTGTAQTSATPDRAVIQLGAAIQHPEARAAQEQVNEIMTRAIEAIRGAGIEEASITTVGLSLHPVYSQQPPPRPREGQAAADEPRIVGYRASNSVRVRIDDLSKVGAVIDAGVGAGANQIEGLSFELKDDTAARTTALRDAAKQARAKADAIADALGVQIEGVQDVSEGGSPMIPMQMGRRVAAMEAATPIQPGQVQVDMSVTVTYRLSSPEED